MNGVPACASCPAVVSEVMSRYKSSADDQLRDKPESSVLRDFKAVLLFTDVSHGFNRVTAPSMLLYRLLSELQTHGGKLTHYSKK